jgi:hypothetical protein
MALTSCNGPLCCFPAYDLKFSNTISLTNSLDSPLPLPGRPSAAVENSLPSANTLPSSHFNSKIADHYTIRRYSCITVPSSHWMNVVTLILCSPLIKCINASSPALLREPFSSALRLVTLYMVSEQDRGSDPSSLDLHVSTYMVVFVFL